MTGEKIRHGRSSVFFWSFVIVIVMAACSKQEKHFISDLAYLKRVQADFRQLKADMGASGDELFKVLETTSTVEEKEALIFLFTYMPLNDLADYPGEFFLNNVRLAFAARDTFQWGRSVPEDIFRHFVLPYRVNNENLDSARSVFFKELHPRIKNMDIEQAALEVNHWCHEKVNYSPTDSRTISPLGAIKTAFGRCGEESTFTVTALRSVGIPARQVYTPRWAHVDDNHAWVEVFVNGKWKYLGACEPEPVLNVGWFSAPVLRAMMVHTKTFGRYMGNELVNESHPKYSTVNTLGNYAPVKDIWVKVVNENNQPLNQAIVEFGLYNYSEFYPLKSERTKADGIASLRTGLGDLRIFASDGSSRFHVSKISVAETDTLVVMLDRLVGNTFELEFENVPPPEKEPLVVSKDGQFASELRLAKEDSIRNSYISTFYTCEKSDALAQELGLSKDSLMVFMKESKGNHPEIEAYLRKGVGVHKNLVLSLLDGIATKDLHDIERSVLIDHLQNFKVFETETYPSDIVNRYILNPRVYLEQIRAYRAYLQHELAGVTVTGSSNGTIVNLLDWINKNIQLNQDDNYYGVTISPMGICKVGKSDPFSLKVFFVAAARSLGIPARLEPATLTMQYYNRGWLNVNFNEEITHKEPDYATVSLKADDDFGVEPLYRIHFGIAKYTEGRFNTLEYDWEKPLSDFPEKLDIEPGYYQITTGNRLDDGTVLVKQQYLSLAVGESNIIDLNFVKSQHPLNRIAYWEKNVSKSLQIIGWINPDSEPGKHFLNDFQSVRSTFEVNEIPMTVFCENELLKIKVEDLLSENCNVEIDPGMFLLNDLYANTGLLKSISLPVFIVIDRDGAVYYHTSGYNIGTSEQLLKIYHRIKNNKGMERKEAKI